MLYANYAREKLHNLILIKEARGYPCVLLKSKGKNLKDYKIYGNSQQGKNLLTYPYVHTTKTMGGLTYTDNGDGSITVKGTSTEASYFTLTRGLNLGKDHITEAVGTNGEYALSKKLRYNANIQAVSIEFKAGVTVDETFYPQVEKGTVSTEYEQPSYFVSPDAPIEVESVGDKTKNLFNPQIFLDAGATLQEDGSYYFANTLTGRNLTVWENTSNYEGQLTLSYKVKYSDMTTRGLFFLFNYDDGTSQQVWGKFTNEYIDVKYTTVTTKKLVSIKTDYGARDTGTNFLNVLLEYSKQVTDYEPYGYKIPVISRGINLFDYRTLKSRNQSSYPLIINDDGSFEYTGNYYITADGSFMKKGKTYVFDYKYESDINPIIRLQYTDDTYTASFRAGNIVSVEKEVKLIMIYTDFTSVIHNLKMWDLILVEGSNTINYEPYVKPITTNIFLNEPLRKIGDYSDYIDFKKKKVIRNIKEQALTGNESFTLLGVGTSSARAYTVLDDKSSDVNIGLCSHFKRVLRIEDVPTSCDFRGTYFRVNVSELNISVVSEWNEYLKNEYDNGMPVKIMYPLATLKEETIELPNIPTIKGTTIIEADTSIFPSDVWVKYISK